MLFCISSQVAATQPARQTCESGGKIIEGENLGAREYVDEGVGVFGTTGIVLGVVGSAATDHVVGTIALGVAVYSAITLGYGLFFSK